MRYGGSKTEEKIKWNLVISRGGKIDPIRWVSLARPKLGPGWAIKLLSRKKTGQIWPGPIWSGPARAEFFFCLENTIWPYRPGF